MLKISIGTLLFLMLISSISLSYSKGSNITSDDYEPLKTSSYIVHYSPFGLASYYDLQSHGSPNEIWQNPLAPDNVHAAVMALPVFGGTRFVNYFLSTDRGATWSLLGNVAESPSGFPSIDGFTNDGKAMVSMQTTSGGANQSRIQVFVDQGAGFGVFDRLDPGFNSTVPMILGRLITTGLSTNPIQFVIACSDNAGMNLAATNTGSSSSPPGTFSGWNTYGGSTAEQYSLALGQDGRIGLAYIAADFVSTSIPAFNQGRRGSVAFRESENNGLTWTTPRIIFAADSTRDSLEAFRGISMIYLVNTPCITYELDNIIRGNVIPTLPSYIMFWSPAVNGGIPKQLAGPNNVPFYPNTGPPASNGLYTPLCRPVIGKTSTNGNSLLFLAFNGTTNQTAADLNVYYATYFLMSWNGGETWPNSIGTSSPERITPATPLKDYRYVSMSHTNSRKTSNPNTRWWVQMIVQSHNYAGAFAPNLPPGASDFLSMRAEIGYYKDTDSGSITRASYSLKQNFPNPFNPNTIISYQCSISNYISLKVYDVLGNNVATLVDERKEPGNYEVEFDGSHLSSGIYFYRLKVDGSVIDNKTYGAVKINNNYSAMLESEISFIRPQNILMCSPDYFEVNYEGNAFMKNNIGGVDKVKALHEWSELKKIYEDLGFSVDLIEPVKGLVDMVFTANQSLPFIDIEEKKNVLLSKMKNIQRKDEVGFFKEYYKRKNYKVTELPPDIEYFESMGDCVIDYERNILFGGYGFRTQENTFDFISKCTNFNIVKLKLVNSVLYHLDTCLSVLNSKTAVISANAFDDIGIAAIKSNFENIIFADDEENLRYFVCNCHSPDGKNVIVQKGSLKFKEDITKTGLTLIEVETGEFIKSGGSVFCMKLMYY